MESWPRTGHSVKDAGAGAGPFVPTVWRFDSAAQLVASPSWWNPLATSATLPTTSMRGVGRVYNSDYQTQHGGSGMLVLSRKVGEVLMIGDAVVTVVKINRDSVRIGITAPPSVSVDRLEVRKAKESNNNSTTGAGK